MRADSTLFKIETRRPSPLRIVAGIILAGAVWGLFLSACGVSTESPPPVAAHQPAASGDVGTESKPAVPAYFAAGSAVPALAASAFAAGSRSLSAYAVDSGGTLTALQGSPYTTGPQPEAVAISPNGKYLYVTNENSVAGSGGLSAYAVGPGGALAVLPGSPYATGPEPGGLAISPDGRYLYVTNFGGDNRPGGVSGYSIGKDGKLTALADSAYSTGPAGSPWGIVISPDGRHLYVTNTGSNDGSDGLAAYAIGPDGALAALPGSPYATGSAGTPWGLTMTPDGKHLYVANEGSFDGSGGLSAYAIGPDGAPTPLRGSPYSSGPQGSPWSIAISPDGKYLHVTNDDSDDGSGGLSTYAVGATGALTALSTSASTTGSEPQGLAISPDGRYVYVTNWGSSNGSGGLSAYAVGPDGALIALFDSPYATGFPGSPWSVVVSPNGEFLYVTNQGSEKGAGGLSAYRVTVDNAPSAPAASGSEPVGVATSPGGHFLYATNQRSVDGSRGLAAYAIGAGGALAALPGSPFATGSTGHPAGVAISPDGRYLYVANQGSLDGSGGISAYAIGRSGTLTALPGSPFSTGSPGYPYAVAISPDGRYLYVTNEGSPNGSKGLSAYSIDSDGGLIALPASPFAAGAAGHPFGLAISPNGKTLYATNRGSTDGSGGLSAYAIGSDGALTPLSGSPYTTGGAGHPYGVALSSKGNYLYVLNRRGIGALGLSVYSVDSGGELTAVWGSASDPSAAEGD